MQQSTGVANFQHSLDVIVVRLILTGQDKREIIKNDKYLDTVE